MASAEATLRRLLQRGERARLTGSARTIRESFKGVESPYWILTYDSRGVFHEHMRAAAAAGAVDLEWSKQGGDDRPLSSVVLRDVERLAAHLGLHTVAESVVAAGKLLEPWLNDHPRVGTILGAWAELKTVRGLAPESASDVVDALRVVDAVAANPGEDRIVRQLSVELFGDSKRIEQLVRHLDVLTAEGGLASLPRHREEVFSGLGLTKEPQPFLVAGSGELSLAGDQTCTIPRPFIGVSNQAVMGYRGTAAWLLSIENLTSFHVAAKQLAWRTDGLILYSGGMPSPAWCNAYRGVLSGLPGDAPVYHWGDFDEGGFRIAVVLSRVARNADRELLPWLMDPDSTRDSGVPCAAAIAGRMAAAAERAGWKELSDAVVSVSHTCEQESQRIRLPPMRNR